MKKLVLLSRIKTEATQPQQKCNMCARIVFIALLWDMITQYCTDVEFIPRE